MSYIEVTTDKNESYIPISSTESRRLYRIVNSRAAEEIGLIVIKVGGAAIASLDGAWMWQEPSEIRVAPLEDGESVTLTQRG